MGLKFDGAEGQEQGRSLYECGESGCVSLITGECEVTEASKVAGEATAQ